MHYLTVCDYFSEQRLTLYESVSNIIPNFNTLSNDNVTHCLLFGVKTLKDDINTKILTATISFIKETKRFDKLEAFDET